MSDPTTYVESLINSLGAFSKSDAARKAAISKAVNDAVTESTANLEKVSTVAKSLVGMVIPITGASEIATKG